MFQHAAAFAPLVSSALLSAHTSTDASNVHFGDAETNRQ
jgi:hypothetical protein